MYWKLKFLQWLLSDNDILIVCHEVEGTEHKGAVLSSSDHDNHLKNILYSAIENREEVKDIVLGASLQYLKKYEVDGHNFAKEIYAKD